MGEGMKKTYMDWLFPLLIPKKTLLGCRGGKFKRGEGGGVIFSRNKYMQLKEQKGGLKRFWFKE